MNAKLIKLLFSLVFWIIMLLSSGKLKELFAKEKIESLTAHDIDFTSDDAGQTLTFRIKNDTSAEVTYNTQGHLYEKHGETLVPIPMKEHAMYSGASYYISPGDEQAYTIRLTDYYDWLPYGEYRYVKTVGCLDVDVDFSYQEPEKTKRRRK